MRKLSVLFLRLSSRLKHQLMYVVCITVELILPSQCLLMCYFIFTDVGRVFTVALCVVSLFESNWECQLKLLVIAKTFPTRMNVYRHEYDSHSVYTQQSQYIHRATWEKYSSSALHLALFTVVRIVSLSCLLRFNSSHFVYIVASLLNVCMAV